MVAVVLVFTSHSWTQDLHIPGCYADMHQGGGTTCWGYATAKAFGRGWSSDPCAAGTRRQINAINYDYFEKQTPFDVSQLSAGYIVGWGQDYQPNHVAYVNSTNGTEGGTYLSQVEYAGSIVLHDGYTLTQVINGVPGDGVVARGYPTCYIVKRPRWKARATNSFGDGDVTIGDESGQSPQTKDNL